MLGEEFGLTHLSAGELLRQERSDPNSQYGALIDSCLKEGKIVPVEISLGLLRNAIERCDCDRYLIDGFPRNWDNVLGWNRLMQDVSDLEKVSADNWSWYWCYFDVRLVQGLLWW